MCNKLVGAEPIKVKHFRNGSPYKATKYKLPHAANPGDMLRYNADGDRLYNPNWDVTAKHCDNSEYLNAVVRAVQKTQVCYSLYNCLG